jgi:hypothetical protein
VYRLRLDLGSCRKGKAWLSLEKSTVSISVGNQELPKSHKSENKYKTSKSSPVSLPAYYQTSIPQRVGNGVSEFQIGRGYRSERRPVWQSSKYSSSAVALRTFLVARKHRQFRRFENKSDCFGPLPLPRTQRHENYAQPCSRNKLEFYLGFWDRKLGMDLDRRGSQSSESLLRSGGLRDTRVRCLGMGAGFGFVSRAVSLGHLLKRVVEITSSSAK